MYIDVCTIMKDDEWIRYLKKSGAYAVFDQEFARLSRLLGIDVHVTDEPLNPKEPFGAMIRHRRTAMEIPLWYASLILRTDYRTMWYMEMGWKIPEGKLAFFFKGMAALYRFTAKEYRAVIAAGMKSLREGPMDLSGYLHENVPPELARDRPKTVYAPFREPSSFERSYVEVCTRCQSDGLYVPVDIVWHNGQRFHIDRIDAARKNVHFATGGIGTCFSCWFREQHRIVGYETPERWFVESPRHA